MIRYFSTTIYNIRKLMLLSYEEIQQEQTQHLNYRKKILDYRRNTQT